MLSFLLFLGLPNDRLSGASCQNFLSTIIFSLIQATYPAHRNGLHFIALAALNNFLSSLYQDNVYYLLFQGGHLKKLRQVICVLSVMRRGISL
jgi:hypothetical protein